MQPDMQTRKHCNWKNLIMSNRPELPPLAWDPDRMVAFTLKDVALQKRNLENSKFGRSLDGAL